MKQYRPKEWSLSDVKDFSTDQIEYHLKLYNGYVTNLNALHAKIHSLTEKGEVGSIEYNEIKRRYGWEFNGVRLHEYYFDNLGSGEHFNSSSPLGKQIIEDFGSYENWLLDFKKTGTMRGIGWV